SGGRRGGTASSSTTTRTPRTGRWRRPGPCGPRPTRASRCRSSGARWPAAIPLRSRWPPRRAASARPTAEPAGSPAQLLALSAAQEAAGLGDAPWPPHYRKQHDEPPRVAPSRRKAATPGTERGSRRQAARALVTVAKAARKEEALAGLERWKARHPAAA